MRLSALSIAFLLFAGISAVFGVISGDISLFTIAAGCVSVPAVGLIYHLDLMKKQIAGVEFSRNTDARIIRQNSKVSVSAAFTPANLLSPALIFEDIPPVGAVLTSGSLVFQNGCTAYSVVIPAAGKAEFGGVKVTSSNIFGTITGTLSNAVNPKLQITPTGTASLSAQTNTEYSRKAHNKPALLPSSDIRDFRQYYPGDSVRDIDWKQTLHRDKLFIRVKMDTQINNPVLIFDLPDTSVSLEDVDCFIKTANGVLKDTSIYENVQTVFICGGDVIGTFPLKDGVNISRMLTMAGKREPVRHLFRDRHKLELVSWKNQLRRVSAEAADYHKHLSAVLDATSKRADGEFELQSRNLFLRGKNEDFAVAVSCASGDISHLLYLTYDASAYLQKFTVYLSGIREKPYCSEVVSRLVHAGASEVEVVS